MLNYLLSSHLLNSKNKFKEMKWKVNRIKVHSTSKIKIKFNKINQTKVSQIFASQKNAFRE